jgi:hypothetical protein
MKFSYSLYFQVTLAIIITALFTAAGVGTLNYMESRKVILAQFNRSMHELATSIGESLSSRTDAATTAIMRISGNKLLLSGNAKEIQQFLQVAVDSSSLFNNIYYFAPEGELIAAAYADGRNLDKYIGENFKNYAEDPKTSAVYLDLVKALETQTPVFSAFFQSTTGRLMNSFIVPVVKDNKVAGLLSCGVVLDRTSKLLEQMQRLKPHDKGFVTLLGSGGKILLDAGEAPASLTADLSWTAQPNQTFFKDGFILSVFNLPRTELGICIGLPEEAIAELLADLRKGTLAFTVGVGVFTSLIGLLLSYILISPMNDLVKGLKQLNQGKPANRINRRASGEIAEAISIFNEMNERLRKEQKKESS